MTLSKKLKRRGEPVERRTQQERRDTTRLALIEGTMAALIELGYARTTTPEITRRAKLSSGALQHHFASKDDLMLAVVQHHFDEMRSQLDAFVSDMERQCGSEDWKAFVVLLEEIYSSRRYIPVWEIVLGSRGDRLLHNRILRHRVQSLGILETIWRRIFRNHIRDELTMVDLMHFTLATMRGFVFYNVIAQDKRFLERKTKMIQSLILNAMHEESGTGAVQPKDARIHAASGPAHK